MLALFLVWLGARMETHLQRVADLFPGAWVTEWKPYATNDVDLIVAFRYAMNSREPEAGLFYDSVETRRRVPLKVRCFPPLGLVSLDTGQWELWVRSDKWRPALAEAVVADNPYSTEQWTPKNSDGRFMGDPNIMIALQNSRSVISSRLWYLVVCDKMHEWINGSQN